VCVDLRAVRVEPELARWIALRSHRRESSLNYASLANVTSRPVHAEGSKNSAGPKAHQLHRLLLHRPLVKRVEHFALLCIRRQARRMACRTIGSPIFALAPSCRQRVALPLRLGPLSSGAAPCAALHPNTRLSPRFSQYWSRLIICWFWVRVPAAPLRLPGCRQLPHATATVASRPAAAGMRFDGARRCARIIRTRAAEFVRISFAARSERPNSHEFSDDCGLGLLRKLELSGRAARPRGSSSTGRARESEN